MITLFYRATTQIFAGPCDVADVPVFDKSGAAAGFIGAAWGEQDADDTLHVAVCEPDDVDQVLASWGLKRPQVEPIQGKV